MSLRIWELDLIYIYYKTEAFDYLLTCSTIFHIITHIIYLFTFYFFEKEASQLFNQTLTLITYRLSLSLLFFRLFLSSNVQLLNLEYLKAKHSTTSPSLLFSLHTTLCPFPSGLNKEHLGQTLHLFSQSRSLCS